MWSQMPAVFGKYNSVWRCFSRWCENGFWQWALDQVAAAYFKYQIALIVDCSHIKAHQAASRYAQKADQQCLGKTKGGWNTKLSACVNLAGKAVKLHLMAGQTPDAHGMLETLPDVIKACFVLADKGYDWDQIREALARKGAFVVIPPKKGRKHPAPYDQSIGKLRHRVENFFGRIKRHKRIALRSEQRKDTFLGFITLAAIDDYGNLDFVHVA